MIHTRYLNISASYKVLDGAQIQAGAPVGFNSDGRIDVVDGDTVANFYGIAGDSKLTEGQTGSMSRQVYLGADAVTSYTQNRIPDGYDQTKVSGEMTVYLGGGTTVFTDQFDADALGSADPGASVYVDSNGLFTTDSSADVGSGIVAILNSAPAVIPTDIPGNDVDQSIARLSGQKDNTYILITLK
jgi:hypothetical protein